jgi:hypothetical protein
LEEAVDGFEIELKHGIVLAYQGKPLYHLGDILDEIRRQPRSRRPEYVRGQADGYRVRLGRSPLDPPPTDAEWLEAVNEVAPIIDEFKKTRLGTKALYNALKSRRGSSN